MSAGLTVKGLEELQRKLRKLDSKMGRKVLRKGTRAASTPIQKAIRNAAPVGPGSKKREPGALKKAIGRKFKFYRKSGTDVAVIGPQIDKAKGKLGYHGHIVEHGTKDRTVKDSFGRFERGLVSEPIPMPTGKMPANPFVKRATDAVIEAAGQKGAEALRAALNAEIRTLRGGG